jgi:Protein of unknown function (DUF1566)
MKTARLALAGWLCWPGWVSAEQVCDTRSYALSSPSSQFEDHADGTVTDSKSKLMWMRCSLGQQWAHGHCAGAAAAMTWGRAQAQAAQINQSGMHFFSDWRLPGLRELATLSERQCTAPRVNLQVFPATPAAAYWTTSARANAASQAQGSDLVFTVSFADAGVQLQDKASAQLARLVRNAP